MWERKQIILALSFVSPIVQAMSSKIVIFDFDGVIANTFQMCLRINRLVNPDIKEDEYRRLFEGNINYAKKDRPGRQKIDFWHEYEKDIVKALLFPGIDTQISSLSSRFTCVIVSSTINRPIELFLEQHGLRQYFAEIFGNDVSESKVEKFKMIFEEYQVTAADCMFITDTLGDIKEAKELGIKSIAVTWGYHDQAILEKGNPEAIINNPGEIGDSVQSVLSGIRELNP